MEADLSGDGYLRGILEPQGRFRPVLIVEYNRYRCLRHTSLPTLVDQVHQVIGSDLLSARSIQAIMTADRLHIGDTQNETDGVQNVGSNSVGNERMYLRTESAQSRHFHHRSARGVLVRSIDALLLRESFIDESNAGN